MTSVDGPEAGSRRVRLLPFATGACVLLVAAGVASYLVRGAPLQEMFGAWVFHNGLVGVALVALMGAALRRQPTNRAAWAFFVAGVLGSVHVATMGVGHFLASRHDVLAGMVDGTVSMADLPAAVAWPFWLGTWIWVPAAGLITTLGLLWFPDGRLPSRRWRGVVYLAVTGLVLAPAAWGWSNRPWSTYPLIYNQVVLDEPSTRLLFLVGMPALGLAGLASIASLVVRLRRADPQERRRLRPVAITGSLAVAALVLLYPWQALWAVAILPAILLYLGVLAATITRHRLFDVEVVVSRAVTVAVLGAGVTVAYVAIVAGIGALLGAGERLWLSVAATALIAVGFDPVRRRVLAAATRLVAGTSATPYEALAQLSDRLARADSTDAVLDRVVALLVEATGASRAEVHTRTDDGQRLAAAVGEGVPGAAVRSVPVASGGELLGEVRLVADREDRFLPADDRLVRQVAATLGPVLRNARLTRELHERIRELRASRQRLVTAHDDARRAVERDIHDGAQQHLLALRLTLGVAATHAERDGDAALVRLLDDAAREADTAIRRLRDLAQGLYPPLLAEQGLAAALRAHARHVPVPVTIRADGLGRHHRRVEAAVYFCCLEAIQNVSRHAGAASLDIHLADGDGMVSFAVSDDGVGFDPATVTPGAGLTNMTDRIVGLGGTVEVDSVPGSGTTVQGRVPVVVPADVAQPADAER